MERFQRLPFISGCTAAIIAGVVSYLAGVRDQTVYLRMAVLMLLFYILGVYIRNTVRSVKNEVQIREEELKLEEEQRQKRQKEEMRQAAHMVKPQQGPEHQLKTAAPKLDLVAGGTGDDFEPMTVARAIRTNAKE